MKKSGDMNPVLVETMGQARTSIAISEVWVVKISEVLKAHQAIGTKILQLPSRPPTLCISLLVPLSQKYKEKNCNGNLSDSATNDELASGLIHWTLRGQKGMGSNDIANAICQEDEGCGCYSLGIARDVHRRQL